MSLSAMCTRDAAPTADEGKMQVCYTHTMTSQSLYFTMGGYMSLLKTASSYAVIWTPSNIWFIGPTCDCLTQIPNGISISSAIIAQLMAMPNKNTRYDMHRNSSTSSLLCMRCGLTTPTTITIFTALWILSGITRVSQYQKKHSPTHTDPDY